MPDTIELGEDWIPMDLWEAMASCAGIVRSCIELEQVVTTCFHPLNRAWESRVDALVALREYVADELEAR